MTQIEQIAGRLARRCTRAQWKTAYRDYRVARREILKAHRDSVILGWGFVEVRPGMDPRHVSALALLASVVIV